MSISNCPKIDGVAIFFIALLSTYFPVRSAVRRKPVEVIRAL